jgi:hypothetical protein
MNASTRHGPKSSHSRLRWNPNLAKQKLGDVPVTFFGAQWVWYRHKGPSVPGLAVRHRHWPGIPPESIPLGRLFPIEQTSSAEIRYRCGDQARGAPK